MKRYCRKVPWETPHTHEEEEAALSLIENLLRWWPHAKPSREINIPWRPRLDDMSFIGHRAEKRSTEQMSITNSFFSTYTKMFRMSSTENWILCAIHFLCRRAIQRHISNSSGINYFSLSLSGINTCELLSLQDCAIPFVWHGPPSLKHRTGYHPPPSLSPSCWMGIKWGENNALQFYI